MVVRIPEQSFGYPIGRSDPQMQRSSSGRLWDLSGSPKGRTEVILGVSEAKNAQETDFDVKTRLALQKPGEN